MESFKDFPGSLALPTPTLLGLPDEILGSIFSYLEPRSFLNFCLSSNEAYQHHLDSHYWRTRASRTFRLPISPLLHADGPRWYWLYKKLKTQTRLYTWGQGLQGSLGLGRALRGRHFPVRPRVVFQRTSSAWPTETHTPDEIGIVVDLQCGGWSTTVLTSDGKLFTIGILDAADGRHIGQATNHFMRLEYLTQSTSTIRQFSAGRRHILALDDQGEILSWDRINAKGYKIFSKSGRDFGGKPARVVAGWGYSSAYIPDTGIVYWNPVRNDQQDTMLDGLHIQEIVVPGTARQKDSPPGREARDVLAHIVLEGFIVYITNESKIFACAIGGETSEQNVPSRPTFEVPGYTAAERVLKDLQGSFRSFVVFTDSGEVLAGNTGYLQRCATEIETSPSLAAINLSEEPRPPHSPSSALIESRPADVPALQKTGVISVAFGDYHYLALHANGTITAYGTEPQCCGSLGLGDTNAGSIFRGVKKGPGWRPDAKLLPIANTRGRQVWFEPEKKEWLLWMESWVRSRGVSARLPDVAQVLEESEDKQAIFSEWVEQEGRHWAEGPWHAGRIPQVSEKKADLSRLDYEQLGAYFAISVAAAGWHSGALVLVNEEKAEEIAKKWIVNLADTMELMPEDQSKTEEEFVWANKPFPRLRFPDGFEMPGAGEFRQWRDGMPKIEELGSVPIGVS